MNLATFIKAQRKCHGMTQVDLSRRAGVGLRFIRDMEQGKKTLRMDKVNQVLYLFGKTLGPVDWREAVDAGLESEMKAVAVKGDNEANKKGES